MPKGPRGEKRPADVIGAAVKVMQIATGQIEELLPSRRAAGGQVGGKARAAALSKRKRTEIAKKAATIRWAKGRS